MRVQNSQVWAEGSRRSQGLMLLSFSMLQGFVDPACIVWAASTLPPFKIIHTSFSSCWVVVVHAFNTSTQEAEDRGIATSLRPARSTEFQDSPTEKPLKKLNQTKPSFSLTLPSHTLGRLGTKQTLRMVAKVLLFIPHPHTRPGSPYLALCAGGTPSCGDRPHLRGKVSAVS